MASHSLLLLLLLLPVAWVLAGGLAQGGEAGAGPYGVKLCGREFIRAVIFTCGGSRWRRGDFLAHDSLGDVFSDTDSDAEAMGPAGDEAMGSREWLALTKSHQPFYGGQPSWQGAPGALRGSRDVLTGLSSNCCKWGCSKSDISSLC
ncbi:relaxin-3 [Thomomys bottae]